MAVQYIHLTHEEYKSLEEQMKAFRETSHRSEGGFYHKSIRLRICDGLIMEFHGPLVGGYGHLDRPKRKAKPRKRVASRVTPKQRKRAAPPT